MRRWPSALLVGMVVLGCTPAQQAGGKLSPDEEAAIADTLRAVMQEYVRAWSEITCENQDAVLKFFDWSGPGVIDNNETTATVYPGDAWPQLIREGACGRIREEATLDTLLIRVFSRDLASVSWTFRATYTLKDAPPRSARGAVLQVFRRTAEGWKTPVGMSTHQPLAP